MVNSMRMMYDVDLCFCIDATFSMDYVIDVVRENALNLYGDIKKTMDMKRKCIENLRVKVIAFRDYVYDRENAMLMTDFFSLPSQSSQFRECVNSIKAFGGGDDPEDGLEALAYAIKTNWSKPEPGRKRRHVIVVWSDAATHEIGYGKRVPNYPKGMPKDFNELTMWWGNKIQPGYMDENAKRLLMFTPDTTWWNTVRDNWNNVIHYTSRAGRGLQDYDYQQIINSICNSI